MPNTVREVMIDRIRDTLNGYLVEVIDPFFLRPLLDVDSDLVTDLADEAFSVCGISEKEQKEEW